MPSRLQPLCLCLAALTICSPTWAADEADISHLLSLSLEDLINTPVVTASRQSEKRSQSPAHIIVVTRDQIRERRYRNLADLMEDLPGVDFMRGTKSSSYNNFSVQGYAGSNKLLVMLDGVRVGHPAGGTFPIAENFSLYPAKQVEILYGPAAALYGADAVAGVINIITDQAADAPGASITLSGGNFGSREASFTGRIKNDNKLALSMGGHWQESDRAPLNKYYPADFPKVDAKTFAGTVVVPAANREDYVGGINSHSLFVRLDVGDDLSFGYYRNHFRSLTSTGDTSATALYREDGFWDTTTDTVYGKYRFQLTPRLSGELVLDYSQQEIDPESKYVNIFSGFDSGYSYVRGERLNIEQNLNWKIDDRHRLLAGIGYQDYFAIEASSLPSPYNTDLDPADQNLFYPNTNNTLPIDINDADFRNYSFYTQLQSEWSPKFSTMAGIRHDRQSDYGNSTNARLGAVWHPTAKHYLKLLYGEAFRAPSPEERLGSFGSFKPITGGYETEKFRLPNFNLAPEETKTLSLTWDWRLKPELNLVANAYHSRIKNLIITSNAPVPSIPGITFVDPRWKDNAGEEEHTGLDLMAQYRFQLGQGWKGDLWGSASWISGSVTIPEFDKASKKIIFNKYDIPFVADHKLKLGTTFRYLDRFSVTPRLLWIGDTSNDVRLTAPNRRMTKGYAITDLHIGWHKLLNGKASAWLDINNLFDKRYDVAAGAGTFVDMPQQPRTWTLSLEYPF